MKVSGNVADLMLAQLFQWGVERIYGVSGDAILPLLDAVARQDKISFISVTHEANAAFMASYEAKLTGRLAVCAASAGPGAVSLLNGLAGAYFDQSPVLAVTGQVETKKNGLRTKQYFDQQLLFRNFSSFTSMLTEPSAVLDLMVSAARNSYIDFTVSHISIPRDIFLQPADAETVPAEIIEFKKPLVFSGSSENIVAAIKSSQRPLIVVGKIAEDAVYQVHSLAHMLGAGVFNAQDAKGTVRGRFKMNLGGIGEAYLPPLVQEADCIILLGSAAYEQGFFPATAKVVQLAERPEELSINTFASATGELALLLSVIEHDLENYSINQDWLARVKGEAQKNKQDLVKEQENNAVPIHPLRLMTALNEVIPENAVVALDIGEFTHWFDRGFLGEKQEILLSSMWRSIGCSLPSAIGAKFACPDKAVVALVGDGGMLVSMSELLTCVRYKLPIVVIVVRNQVYSIEKNKMIAQGLTPLGCDLTTPDFVRFARACGAEGFRVEEPAQIQETVRKALEMGRPALVEVICAAVNLPEVK
ncbi:MAG: thiamine pyrophosphate-binding protein [Peptococcaceae bacterium]|nr:thiamine pyrophosphate-binding protein [Peptococcaceae bacterium]